MEADPLSEPKRMLTLMNVGTEHSTWLPEELGAILTHQLDAPLAEVLDHSLTDEWAADDATVRKLLTHPSPPPSLLEQLKRTCKAASAEPDSFLPKEVATVLYIACIACGLHTGQRISNLDDHAVRERLEWAGSRKWLDPGLRELLKPLQP
jgi:hypothetical protein